MINGDSSPDVFYLKVTQKKDLFRKKRSFLFFEEFLPLTNYLASGKIVFTIMFVAP